VLEWDIAVESLAVDNNILFACNEDKGETLLPVSSSEEVDVVVNEDYKVLLSGCANTISVFG